MSEKEQIFQRAAGLPLMDAAYHLWSRRNSLNRLDPWRQEESPSFLAAQRWRRWRELERRVRAGLGLRSDFPTHFATLDRLRKVHPQAGDRAARVAVAAAVKLDSDCCRHFSYQSPNYLTDVDRAVARARTQNPGFQEGTYKAAWHVLAIAMR